MSELISNGILIRAEIIRTIKDAKESISLVMAYFTDKEIFDEIIRASSRGVVVNIILSNDEMNRPIINTYLGTESTSVKMYIRSLQKGIMHNKFCIIDGKIILKGTYNYTISASRHNDETLEVSTDYTLISSYESIYNDLKRDSIEAKSESKSTTEIPIENNDIDLYSNKIQELVSDLIDKFDQNDLTKSGYDLSKNNNCDTEQFKNGLDLNLNSYKVKLQTDEQIKKSIKVRIEAAQDDKLNQLEQEFRVQNKRISEEFDRKVDQEKLSVKFLADEQLELKTEKNKNENRLIDEKSKLEQVNSEIARLNITMGVIPFTFKKTWFNFIFLSIIFTYLFVFYTSAIYNLVYVQKEAEIAANAGADLPKIEFFNSSAIPKLFIKGFGAILFNFIAVFIPIGLALSKLYTKNKYVQFILGWIVAVLIVDFFVAISISQTIATVDSLRLGTPNTWTVSQSFYSLDFWKVFIFGAIPLIMFKLLSELIYSKWRNSQPDIIDKEKSISLKLLIQDKVSYQQAINEIEFKIQTLNEKISIKSSEVNQKEMRLNEILAERQESLSRTELFYDDKKSRVKQITSNYIADIESGNIKSLKDVITARIAAFKQGFIKYIKEYYSEQESNRRIELINKSHTEWNQRNF